ncbi:MAG: SUMF1/EgtB/PvdO family nonheme iron enzyme [Anaerolineae bacterium]
MEKRICLSVLVILLVSAASSCQAPSLGDTQERSSDGAVMVYVPAGEFEMGSTEGRDDEQPVHTVTLDSFWIDRTEVTNGQYALCVEAGACELPTGRPLDYGDSDYEDYPVTWVNWRRAQAYCEWAGARLPTEAEWEYAARGPEGRQYPWGDEFDATRLNYCDASCGENWADDSSDDGYADKAPVASYPDGASWVGTLDMTGNAWEWVADWYGDYPSGQEVNPTGPPSGEYRVVRGGSWRDLRSFVRSTTRARGNPTFVGVYVIGFRCAADSE